MIRPLESKLTKIPKEEESKQKQMRRNGQRYGSLDRQVLPHSPARWFFRQVVSYVYLHVNRITTGSSTQLRAQSFLSSCDVNERSLPGTFKTDFPLIESYYNADNNIRTTNNRCCWGVRLRFSHPCELKLPSHWRLTEGVHSSLGVGQSETGWPPISWQQTASNGQYVSCKCLIRHFDCL